MMQRIGLWAFLLTLCLSVPARAQVSDETLTNFEAATTVIGQKNFTTGGDSNAGNLVPSAQTLSNPYGLFISGIKLYVSDFNDARVLIFGL